MGEKIKTALLAIIGLGLYAWGSHLLARPPITGEAWWCLPLIALAMGLGGMLLALIKLA